MNKVITGAIVGLAMGVMSAASALDISVGGGINYGYDIVGQGLEADYTYGGQTYKHTFGFPASQYGLNVFLDATFVEVGLGFGFAGGKESSEYLIDGQTYSAGSTNADLSYSYLGISVLGKYNLPFKEGMEVFPALGFEYELVLGADVDDNPVEDIVAPNLSKPFKAGDLSQFRIKLGVGYDYILSEKVYLRALALYGLGIPSEFSKKYKENFFSAAVKDNYDAALTHNVTVKVGIGYKF